MISIFYITAFLSRDPGVRAMRGGNSLSVTLSFGCAVVGIFSAIFLFYTNSFIVKRRRRELGLYNILGMAKHNIAEVMFVENAIIGAAGLVFGLVFGVLLSKLAQMCLFRLMGHVAGFDFYVSVPLLLTTSAVYAVIFTVIYLGSLKRLGTASPIELLHESSVGERAPKGNLPAALVGLVILGSGYWLALSIKDPLQVTLLFFVAVILVIIGTYMLHIRQRDVSAASQEEPAVLLLQKALCACLRDELPYEAQRRGACVHLHSLDDGGGYAFIGHESLYRAEGHTADKILP